MNSATNPTSAAQTIHVNYRPFPASGLRILNLHADYACENTGGCCRKGWKILLGEDDLARLRAGVPEGDPMREAILQAPPIDTPALGPASSRDAIIPMPLDERGYCHFCGESDGASLCLLQRQHGHTVLPAICQTYPRMAVATPAGVYLTLSYACPTAARLLLGSEPIREVTPQRVFAQRPELIGASFTGDVQPPRFSNTTQPFWAAFDYFWRWAADWAAGPRLTPAQALYGLGQVVGHIESLGAPAGDENFLIERLNQVMNSFPPTVQAQAAACAPCTELGVVYMDTLLNMLYQNGEVAPDIHEVFEALGRGPAGLPRERVTGAYDNLLRPRLPEFERIERNWVASRLYANPLAWRCRWLRTGYFTSVLMLIALRFTTLALSLRDGRDPDEETWLSAAGIVDRLLLHRLDMQVKLLELLEANIVGNTGIGDLAQPALF